MPVAAFNGDSLRDLLPFYYRRLFPYKQFFEWVTYGDENHKRFQNREFSFTLEHDIYVRYQSFQNAKEMECAIKENNPHKIDIGAIFDMQPKHHKRGPMIPVEKELVFDIDMTDYDDVRSCCQGADVCTKCWKFMAIACKILDKALRDDFGYSQLLWVFSGRRGIHCWVCDENARNLDNEERGALVAFLENESSRFQHPKRDKFHPTFRRALGIIENEFVETLVEEQDILGTGHKVKKLVERLPEDLANKDLLGKLMDLPTSLDRWKCLVNHVKQFQESAAGKGLHQFAIEEIMLRYAYPRLDVNVSTGLNHLLKAPFCVHPKSGKVCVPFNPKTVDKFDPSSIPTLSQLVDEVRVFDEKEKSFAAASGAGKATVPSAELPPQVKDVDEAMDTSTDETEKCAEDRNASPEVVTGADGETVPMDESLPQTESGVGEQQTDGAAGKEVSASDDVPSSEPSDGNWTKETPGEKVGAVEVKKLKAEQEAENAATDNGQVILDYKKTSMYKGILVFETFLRKLKIARNEPSGDMEDEI